MTDVTVRDMVEKCECKLLIGNLNEKIEECFIDSKKVINGGCFFGIKGKNIDGSLFYKEAFDNGASICVISKIYDLDLKGYDDKTVLVAKDTLRTLQKIAEYKRSLFKGEVIGITGSVGKTSTKNMIVNILKSKYKILTNRKNENSQIGVPLTIMRLKDEEVIVLEMGMSKKGEMHNLSLITKPTISLITNILDSHIQNFNTRENILNAKLEILDYMDKGVLILNNDDTLLRNYNNDDITILKYGISNEGDITATNIKENIVTKFDIDEIKDIIVLGGKEFVYNALASVLVARLLNVKTDDIKKGIITYKNEEHRLQIIDLYNNITLIDDTYNANYDSVMAAVKLISNFKDRRKIVVLGDILELGSSSKKIHKKIGNDLSDFEIDMLITVGKYSKLIKKVYKKKVKKIRVKHFRKELRVRKYLKRNIKNNDVILFKASNGIKLVNLVNYIKNI